MGYYRNDNSKNSKVITEIEKVYGVKISESNTSETPIAFSDLQSPTCSLH